MAITVQFALGLSIAVVPWPAHGPVLVHQSQERSSPAAQQKSHVHGFKLARRLRDGKGPETARSHPTKVTVCRGASLPLVAETSFSGLFPCRNDRTDQAGDSCPARMLSPRTRLLLKDIVMRVSCGQPVSLNERILVQKFASRNPTVWRWLRDAQRSAADGAGRTV